MSTITQLGLTSIALGMFACSEYDFTTKQQGYDNENLPVVSEDQLSPNIIVNPQIISYGVVYAGDSSSDIFTVESNGDVDLFVSHIEILTGEELGYSIVLEENLPWLLAPGESKIVLATYSSQDNDFNRGEVVVTSNDPDQGEVLVELVNEPYEAPPEEVLEECENSTTVELSDEIYVLSWGGGTTGTLEVQEEGLYHVYNSYVAESGASQTNETAYFRITNDANPEGTPVFANCNNDWVLPDLDNDGPLPVDTVAYVGTFHLTEGTNSITIYHYCHLFRAGECTDLHINIDPNSTCDTQNSNSVHFTGAAICLVPA